MNKDYYAGILRGKEEERERIIALLEAKSDWYYSKAIAAIKGEN